MNSQQIKQALLWIYGEARQGVRRQWKPDLLRVRAIQILAVIPIMALPRKYRQHMVEFNDQEILRAGAVSGMFQFAFFGILYAVIYLAMALSRLTDDLPLQAYLTDPRTLPLAYLLLEGMVRYVSARFWGTALPILPLGLIAALHGLFERRTEAIRMGPPVPDLLLRGDGEAFDWRVESWAPKSTWETNPYLMISFRDTFYEVVGKEKTQPPRPNVYLLKRPPSWKLIVKPEIYNPFSGKKP
jgi:hypothetical protein